MQNTTTKLDKFTGPIKLPLEVDNIVHYYTLYYFEYQGERWSAVAFGDINSDTTIPLRIESACFFGHVFHSRQCDCGFQLTEAFKRIQQEGIGMVIYGIDQDARGIGIENHFKIYDLRQNQNLDTEAVFEKLNTKLDNRNYDAVALILHFFGINKIKLLSNNPGRIKFLQENGFSVIQEELEAPLDRFNMATMMLEKEDLNYKWSFQTHAHWLAPLQEQVSGNSELYAGKIVANNKGIIASWIGNEWNVANNLYREIHDARHDQSSSIVYLTDYPRKDEIRIYASLNISLIVMPFTNFPEYLLQEAKEYGIKLQDWSRENKYQAPRRVESNKR